MRWSRRTQRPARVEGARLDGLVSRVHVGICCPWWLGMALQAGYRSRELQFIFGGEDVRHARGEGAILRSSGYSAKQGADR
jgi:hypothetical protein